MAATKPTTRTTSALTASCIICRRLVLTGKWILNLGCPDPAQLGSAGAFQIADANNYANRFCTVKPPTHPTDVPAGAACDLGPYPYISPARIANAAS